MEFSMLLVSFFGEWENGLEMGEVGKTDSLGA